jgi:peptide/nickel transport system permease protein
MKTSPAVAAAPDRQSTPSRRRLGSIPRPRLRGGWSTWAAIVSAIFLALVVILAIASPGDPNTTNLGESLAGPSGKHLLGTDAAGRDLFARIVEGARPSLLGPALAVLLATVLASTIAVTAAWFGGWPDRLLARAVDILFAFPGILLALLAAAVFDPSFATAIIAVGVAEVPYIARVIRTEALRQRSRPYIEASRVQGFSGVAVVWRHLIPNLLPIIATQMALSFGYVMMNIAAVSFLGLGIQPPSADWGSMVAEGQSAIIEGHPQESLYASVCIVLVVVAFTLIGDYFANRLESHS